MMKLIPGLLMSVAAMAVVSCSDDESANLAANAASENASAMTVDPNNPFGQAEMQMHERMMAATGANASETWVRKMIEHHRGAIAMSEVLINGGGDPAYVEMARMESEKQQSEIGELERLLSGGITGGSGEANPFGPVEQRMNQQMMGAAGANVSETWARKMIAHHQGAIDMSELLIRQGGNPQVLAMARKTAEDQRRDIAHLESMLRGEPMSAAASPESAPPAAAPKESPHPASTGSQPEAKSKAAPAPRAAERTEPASRPATPAPAETPKETCAPEHRALGHC